MSKISYRRIAIVNRGEPAMRLIRAARELNLEHGSQIVTIAFFTDADRNAMFVREADEAWSLGPALFVDPRDSQRKSSYLDHDRLEAALRATRAEAAWVGWGFVAEQAEFVELCDRLRVVFVGPSAEVMRQLGDKMAAKRLAEQAGIPVAPWSGGPVEDLEQAIAQAAQIGYPLLVKATAGGGGRGIRKVHRPEQLPEAFTSARSEALRAFGDPTVFLEKMISGARHVEVQVIGDRFGTVWSVGVRDCTIQRRNQKVIEEAPSPATAPPAEEALRRAAVDLARTAGYHGVGTVEFLFDAAQQTFWFMEMNTRLQVEHPVTEVTTGLDLVKLQLLVAAGQALEGRPPPTVGHAIEVRLNAEDPDNNFAPAPGRVELFSTPVGPGLRVDAALSVGDSVPPEFDSMIAKLIAYGRDRREALARMSRALRETAVVIRGGTTNHASLVRLLSRPEVQQGEVDIEWLDRIFQEPEAGPRAHADLALIQTAAAVYERELSLEKARFLSSLVRGRPHVRNETGLDVELRYGGQTYRLHVRRLGVHKYRVVVDRHWIDVEIYAQNAYQRLVCRGGTRVRTLYVDQGTSHLVEINGVSHRIYRDAGGMVRAPAPALVVMVHAREGEVVKAASPVAILEAMKMEIPVLAPFEGRVRKVMVAPNQQVDAGAPLVLLDAAAGATQRVASERVAFAGSLDASDQRAILEAAQGLSLAAHIKTIFRLRSRQVLGELGQLLLGFDVPPGDTRRLLRDYSTLRDGFARDDLEMLGCEIELLELFTDQASFWYLAETSEWPALITVLRASDEGKAIAPGAVETLQRLLDRYGVADLRRTPELEEALYWLQRAKSVLEPAARFVVALLHHVAGVGARLAEVPALRELLDRMVRATHDRLPEVSELARRLRFETFDLPRLLRKEAMTHETLVSQLEALFSHAAADQREATIRLLVDSPHPLLELLFQFWRAETTDPSAYCHLIEVYIRRFYREHPVRELTAWQIDGICCARASYMTSRRERVAISVGYASFASAERAMAMAYAALGDMGEPRHSLVDLLLRLDEPLEVESLPGRTAALLGTPGRPSHVDRVCFSVRAPSGRFFHYTYRRREDGFAEDLSCRGIHHMQAERLETWRLREFEAKQVHGDDDVFVFRCAARDNPADRRMITMVDVRDVTVLRDERSQLVEMPHLERVFAKAISAMQDALAQSAEDRPRWNRIYLCNRTPLPLAPEELEPLGQKLAELTKNLGFESIVLRGKMRRPSGRFEDVEVVIDVHDGAALHIAIETPSSRPIQPLTPYLQKVMRLRRHGLVYPYELIRLLTPQREGTSVFCPVGSFVEHDLDAAGRLVPVQRPHGENTANVVVGVIQNNTSKHPEGMVRVIILGDPSRELGAVAEPECQRIVEALNLAEALRVPVEWFSISSGAKISLTSGTENLDWTARVLKRLVEFTQAGGMVNVVVTGVNVGAQSYWNAEATMLMHTRGILIMTPTSSMILTGKKALDYSGGVSAESNEGIGGLAIMGPNGQAQYAAKDITQACLILLHHYAHTYVAPGERSPRRAHTSDPPDRDITRSPHPDESGFQTVGQIFSADVNPDRKKPFDARSVMQAVMDQDHMPFERWAGMKDAETVVVMDCHIGGIPVCMLGIESRAIPRSGFVPGDGPDAWTAGTLFPLSSKKMARAINAASANRPVVILANLTGFDGSPESMRKLQLEYGAEIGRAVVNFKGPMIFCVISRYHGGAYVVFSRTLNPLLEVSALSGSYASVIGGAPAAAVVFPAMVKARVHATPEVKALHDELAAACEAERPQLYGQLNALLGQVATAKQKEVAEEFDGIHSVERARQVGSIDEIIPPSGLRPYLINALERGLDRWTAETPNAVPRAHRAEDCSSAGGSSPRPRSFGTAPSRPGRP